MITICDDYLPLLGPVAHKPNVKVVTLTKDDQVREINAIPSYEGFRKYKKDLPKEEKA